MECPDEIDYTISRQKRADGVKGLAAPQRSSPAVHPGWLGVKSREHLSQAEQPNRGRGNTGITAARVVHADATCLSLATWLPNQESRDNYSGRGQAFADGVFGKLGNTSDL